MMKRIGIFGGTFDPIHNGHLAIAEEARWAFGFEYILFIPAAQQPLKRATGHQASPEQRLAMVERACAGNPHFRVSDIEVLRQGPSYTVDTLLALKPQIEAEFFFILGADAIVDLYRWYRVEELLQLTQIAAIARPGYQLDRAKVLQSLPALEQRLHVLEGPRLDISSTNIRQRLTQSQPIRYQVPDTVISYIEDQRLYRSSTMPVVQSE
jgi:nicotinate-nucleotide adenylyltransferase